MPAGSISANGSRIARWTIGILALLLLAYAVVRACTVSFSYDETFTFMEHVRKDMFYQRAFDQMGGNHHLLNVWGMWVSMKLFGTSEMALRLPNLLAYVGYLYAGARIALRARHAVLAIAAFVLLNAHPYLIDFFSLARGYGLACGFMMMSLWQAWRFFDEGKSVRRLAVTMSFVSLAAMSHVIMINYLLAFGLAVLIFLGWWSRTTGLRQWRTHLVVLIGIGAAGLAIILPNALGLFHGGSLNFGCDGIWNCMIRTISEKIIYHMDYGEPALDTVARVLFRAGAWCLVVLLLTWWKNAWEQLMPMLFGLLVLGACFVSFWLQYQLFDVPFPQTRTGLFLLPLSAFVVVAGLIRWPSRPVISIAIACWFCVPLLVHAQRCIGFVRSDEWISSGEVRTALELIEKDHLPLTESRPLVCVGTGFESDGSMGYYVASRQWTWLEHTARDGRDSFPRSDYYLVDWDCHDKVDHANWEELFHSDATGLSVFRDVRMHRTFDRVVYHGRFLANEHEADALPEISWTVPEGVQGPIILSGKVEALERGVENWLGLTLLVERGGVVIEQGGQPSHRQVQQYGEWGTVSAEFMPTKSLMPGDVVRFEARPCFLEPAIDMRDAELWVLQ
ncbi:MAG: glycosyltransferase family 39 protein [Flavobacteriales bacterium]|nr:glycosyltransferase family 39 protein [Flavobacteriales bacterium]